MEPQQYHYCVTRLNDQHTTLMDDDIFKFSIRVTSYSIDPNLSINPGQLLYHSPSQRIPCQNFFQEGQEFLQTKLSCIHRFIESLEEITERVVSTVQEMFHVNGDAYPPSLESQSQRREIPLTLEIMLLNNGVLAAMETAAMEAMEEEALEEWAMEAMEESMHNFRMIPATNEAIKTSLKSTVMTRSDSCPICLQEMNVNAKCCTMPCNHVFHQQCIVTWLQTSHVCPLCRYRLSTLKN